MLVYLLQNQINGKAYVGQHNGYDLNKRWKAGKYNSYLTAAIRKYGSDSFKRTILAYASCQEELDLLEQFWIQTLQTCNRKFGYNRQMGGRNWHGGLTPETRKRIGESLRRLWKTKTPQEKAEHARLIQQGWQSKSPEEMDAMKRKVSQALRLVWQTRARTTEPHSKKTRERISDGLKRYYAQLPPKKPCVGVRGQGRQERPTNRPETRAMVALREVKQAEQQLREIRERLNALRFELEGGCTW
jgi:group I intron endonuclease